MCSDASELAGGDPQDNARIVSEILTGGGTRAANAAVILNAAAAIYVSGRVSSYGDGVESAKAALESGQGAAALERLRDAYSHKA